MPAIHNLKILEILGRKAWLTSTGALPSLPVPRAASDWESPSG
jgi:hypothetical protein